MTHKLTPVLEALKHALYHARTWNYNSEGDYQFLVDDLDKAFLILRTYIASESDDAQ